MDDEKVTAAEEAMTRAIAERADPKIYTRRRAEVNAHSLVFIQSLIGYVARGAAENRRIRYAS